MSSGAPSAPVSSSVINAVDLSVPGPVNDTTTTGTLRFTFQIGLAVTGIPINEIGLVRRINRTASATINGQQQPQTKVGLDGPSAPTVLRFANTSLIAVADDPGYEGQGRKDVFPVAYNAAFELFCFDTVSAKILAKVTYDLSLSKQSFADTNPVTSLSNVAKTIF